MLCVPSSTQDNSINYENLSPMAQPLTPSQHIQVYHQLTNSPSFQSSTYIQETFEIPAFNFYFMPPDDFQIYHVTCKEIPVSFEVISQLLNNIDDNNNNNASNPQSDCFVFYFQQYHDKKIYQVTCSMVSHTFIINLLNKRIYGLGYNQYELQQQEFSKWHQMNLKYHLKRYLLTCYNLNENENTIQDNFDGITSTIQSNSEQATEDGTYHVTSMGSQASTNSANPQHLVHPSVFFYKPPNEFCHYYVKCKEVHYDTVASLLSDSLNGRNIQFNENEFIFFYRQQHNNQFYQVSCEVVSPYLINNCLNKNFLGIELQQDMGQENLKFTVDQKENLEYYLKQYLSQYLLSQYLNIES